ncbi:hypothetical protein [Thiocystis violascens]|uniref:ATPase (AAA+ superfamily) n=1 Tax=Thiocystis violascens (strain ATCC 17096 / DSM 198 / 6111) TaxID=765911 RepID=I3Y9G0_THIV6|nr:hypothetical protein [Thiocystis violascens]AFL73628.1 hypothetical protein Thivi_1649 [Thiocystis violascens DSM 198]
MKANPGGQIDLAEVVGRDQLIERIWDTLEQQSIRMTAERRIGKTTIIRKLCAEPRPGWVPIFQDLERYHSAREFALSVYQEVDRFLSRHKRFARRSKDLLKTLGGTEVGGVLKLPEMTADAPWQDILTVAIQDLVEERERLDARPLFLWDEVPYMLASIKAREGEPVAMAVLDSLRALRQTHGAAGLRMVLTGSIGLHHVIAGLKRHNYANSPLNDTYPLEVPPLDADPARELAARLIEGERIRADCPSETAAAVARLADGFPFYIHHLVKALKQAALTSATGADPALVEQVVAQQLLDPNDPWELSHYRERIPVYYGQDSEQAVLGILDGIAARAEDATPVALSINALLAEGRAAGTLDDRDRLIDLLRLMEQDHYLSRDVAGGYRFRFPLLQRWWRLARGL